MGSISKAVDKLETSEYSSPRRTSKVLTKCKDTPTMERNCLKVNGRQHRRGYRT